LKERRRHIGAGKGTRSKKSGQSIFFEGYKKHTLCAMIRWNGKWRRVPVRSLARAGNISEQRVVKPLLNFARRQLRWPILFVIEDKGYINQELARWMRRAWGMAQVIRPKSNMIPPKGCDVDGCPLCPLGERLAWEDYDSESEQLIYRGNPDACRICPLKGDCPRQFEYDAGRNETFAGMVPSHSRLAKQLLQKLRPQVEPGFNLAKNRYDLKSMYINSRHLAQTLCVACDVLETLNLMAQERPARGRETLKSLLAESFQLELWDKF
jgi:hypothetical protein